LKPFCSELIAFVHSLLSDETLTGMSFAITFSQSHPDNSRSVLTYRFVGQVKHAACVPAAGLDGMIAIHSSESHNANT
jgi:hypothetical protein